jgi:hypothetical protein
LQNPYEHYQPISFDGIGDEGVDLTGWSSVWLGKVSIIGKRSEDQEITFQYYYRLLKEFVESNQLLR